MTEEQQLKLQAFLDQELPDREAREVEARIARDAEARALHTKLKNTRAAVQEAGSLAKLPESREFFWSKIEREIQRLEPASPSERPAPLWARFRRLLVPVGSLAGFAIVLMVAVLQFHTSSHPATEIAMADTFTYHNDSDGTTLVWLSSYPSQR